MAGVFVTVVLLLSFWTAGGIVMWRAEPVRFWEFVVLGLACVAVLYRMRAYAGIVRWTYGPLGWYRPIPLPTSTVLESWELRWNPRGMRGKGCWLDVYDEGVVLRVMGDDGRFIPWHQMRRLYPRYLHHDACDAINPVEFHPKDMKRLRAIWEARTAPTVAPEPDVDDVWPTIQPAPAWSFPPRLEP